MIGFGSRVGRVGVVLGAGQLGHVVLRIRIRRGQRLYGG
jgi:hypothetical protein